MIDKATLNDLDRFSGMAESFAINAGRTRFNREAFLSAWQTLLAAGSGHIYGRFVGNVPHETIAVVLYPDPFDGDWCASVAFWHFDHEASGLEGGLLYKRMVEDLRERGVKKLFYAVLNNPRMHKVTRFLDSAGFVQVETNYRKDLCQ